jgi:outer membrane autotransporter protein
MKYPLLFLPLSLLMVHTSVRADYHVTIDSGQTVSGDVVDGRQGYQYVYGTLTDSTITGWNAYSYVASGGQTDILTVTQEGTLFLEPGSLANHTSVTAGGQLQINGCAENSYVDNGGEIDINQGENGINDPTQGGQARNTTVGPGGVMINRYGVDSNTVVEAGGELDTGRDYPYEIRNTALSQNAVINAGGIQRVTNGGTSENSQVETGGTLIVSGTWHYDSVIDPDPSAWYYGTATDSVISGEMQNLGGVDTGTTLQSGGQYVLDSYGVSHQLTVDQGGYAQINKGTLDDFGLYGVMAVSNEAILTGSGTVGSSGELVLNEGAHTASLDLTLAGHLSLQNSDSATSHQYQLASLTLDGGTVGFDSTSFTTLNMDTLSGNGDFYLHTDIAGAQGDSINVSGDASGEFGIMVADTGVSPLEPSSLQIVHTGGGDAQFTLLNPDQQVDLGTWEYGLVSDGQGNWSLAPQASPTPTPSTDAVLALANVTPTIFQTEIAVLQARLDTPHSHPREGELWMEALSNRFDVNRNGNAAYRQTLGGMMMGYDTHRTLANGILTLGIAGSYSRSNLEMTNNSTGTVDSYSTALYAHYDDPRHFWLDGVLKANLFNQHLAARMSSGGRADGSYTTPGIGGSLVTGYDAHLANTTLSPFIGFTGFTSQSDDYRLSNGMQAHPGTAKSALAQVGVRVSQPTSTHSGAQFTPWVKVALEQEFVHSNTIRVNSDRFNNDIAGSRGSYQAGISAMLTPQTQLNVSMMYEKGDGIESPWTGSLGMNYAF